MPNMNVEETKYLMEKLKEHFQQIKDLVRVSGMWYFVAPKVMNYNTNLKPKEGFR
jgi:hypothetical protein